MHSTLRTLKKLSSRNASFIRKYCYRSCLLSGYFCYQAILSYKLLSIITAILCEYELWNLSMNYYPFITIKIRIIFRITLNFSRCSFRYSLGLILTLNFHILKSLIIICFEFFLIFLIINLLGLSCFIYFISSNIKSFIDKESPYNQKNQ